MYRLGGSLAKIMPLAAMEMEIDEARYDIASCCIINGLIRRRMIYQLGRLRAACYARNDAACNLQDGIVYECSVNKGVATSYKH